MTTLVCSKCGRKFTAIPLAFDHGQLLALTEPGDMGQPPAVQGLTHADSLMCPGLCGGKLEKSGPIGPVSDDSEN